jgi:hypothetical protein
MTPSRLPQSDPIMMKTASRFLRLLAVFAIVVSLGVVVWYVRGWQLRTAIMAELQPVALENCTLKRFGSAHDGGYLMCENLLEPLDAGYSYGVGFNDDWGCDVSRRYQVPVHQYDCFDPTRPTCDGGTFVFHDECIGARTETIELRVFDTLDNQIQKNGHTGRSVVGEGLTGGPRSSIMLTAGRP